MLVYIHAPPRIDCCVAALTVPQCRPSAPRRTMRQHRPPLRPTPVPPGPHRPARRPRGPSSVVVVFIALSPYPQPIRSSSLAATVSTSLLLQWLWHRRMRGEKMSSPSHPHPSPCSSLKRVFRLFISPCPHVLIVAFFQTKCHSFSIKGWRGEVRLLFLLPPPSPCLS